MTVRPAINFQKWIDENEHLLKPPVGNKKVFEDGDMTVQVVGGPNEWADYHDDPVEEFFYQLKGDIVVRIIEDGRIKDVPLGEGETFFVPGNVPHSSTRPPDGTRRTLAKRFPSRLICERERSAK